MKYSLRFKLSLSYMLIALVLIALVSISVNNLFQTQFRNYIIKQREQKNIALVGLVEKQYQASNNNWNISQIENIGVNALEQGIIMKVKDNSGKTIWDATVHNNGLCVQMLNHMADNMQRQYPNFKGGYEQTTYPVKIESVQIGNIEMGYYGPYYYTDIDIAFLNNVNKFLIAVGLAFLALAFLLGSFMAKRISKPISKSIQAAGQIASGNLKHRISEKSDTREMVELMDTINHLGNSLEKQENLRRQMSADVAHELRTPLANLQSSLEAMIDGIWEPNSERLESCHEEIIRIGRLVGDLEKLERIEAENSKLVLSEFNLSELVQHKLTNFETEFYKKQIQFQFSGAELIIRADKDKISQVITNLISNAIKYTPEGGLVNIQVKENQHMAELTVKDSGQGIPSEDLPFIFERFYRADKSRNRLTGGSGLGLTITKAIVESHNGKINVVSEIGKGSAFTVLLPLK